MFSSPHSHDAMRRLLKAAVGVMPKHEMPVSVSDVSSRRIVSGPHGDSKSIATGSNLDDKGSLRT